MKKIDNSSKPKGTRWTKASADAFIAEIRPWVIASGFDIGLTGSMLDHASATDLDLIIYPLNASYFNRGPLIEFLDRVASVKMSPDKVKRAWESLYSNDSKHVEKRELLDGRLLDIFWTPSVPSRIGTMKHCCGRWPRIS